MTRVQATKVPILSSANPMIGLMGQRRLPAIVAARRFLISLAKIRGAEHKSPQ
jgi:hypothetical protein